jgi:hypothetical protein
MHWKSLGWDCDFWGKPKTPFLDKPKWILLPCKWYSSALSGCYWPLVALPVLHDLIKLGRNSSSNSLLWSDDSLRIRNQNDKLQPRYLHGSGCCRHGSWNVWCDDQIQCWAICMSTVSVCMSFLIHMTCVYLCTLHVSIYAYYLIYMYIILTYIIGRQKDRNRRIHKHGPKPKQCQTA